MHLSVKYLGFPRDRRTIMSDEEAVEQEREEDAEPDVASVEEVEEDESEGEIEEDNEEAESEKIEEREDGMVSGTRPKKPAAKSKKRARRSVPKKKSKSR